LSSTSASRRVAVTGSGTAGHILTALEILAAYRREFGSSGIFIGSEAGFESRLTAESGERLELIHALPWARQSWWGRMRALFAFAGSFFAARRIFRREGTEIVIGTGGYASVAPCLAGWALGLPVAIHEANAVPGLANEILSRLVNLICVDSEETAQCFRSGRSQVVVTGTPCLSLPRTPMNKPGDPEPAQSCPVPPFRFIVLGGSEGSPFLNQRVPAVFAELRRRSLDFSVLHLTGMASPDATRATYESLGVPARVEGWVTDMGPVYSGATMAIACPGARTLAELAAAGIPSLLTPLPGVAHGHHAANARAHVGQPSRQTGARFVDEAEWDTLKLATWIESVLKAPDALREMQEGMRGFARSGAAEAIVRAAENLVAQPSQSRSR